MVYGPRAAYAWVPPTLNGPPVGPLTVPALVLPSPQSIVVDPPPLLKSALVAPGLMSVNVARVWLTGLVEEKPGLAAAARGASPTLAVPAVLAELPPSSTMLTLTA